MTQQAPPSEPITLIASVGTDPQHLPEVRAALAALAKATRTEDGCLGYEVYESAARPGRIVWYERWASAAALTAHHESSAVAGFTEAMTPFVTAAPETELLTSIDSPEQQY